MSEREDFESADALCLTVVARRTIQDVRVVLGIDDVGGVSRTFDEAADLWDDDRHPIQLFTSGPHVVVLEANGFAGVDPAMLIALAGGNFAISVFWNVSSVMALRIVRDGSVIRWFDPLMRPSEPGTGDVLPEEVGLRFGVGHARTSALTLINRLMRLDLTKRLLFEAPHDTWLRHVER